MVLLVNLTLMETGPAGCDTFKALVPACPQNDFVASRNVVLLRKLS